MNPTSPHLTRASSPATRFLQALTLTFLACTAFAVGSASAGSVLAPDAAVNPTPIRLSDKGGPAKAVSAVIDGAVGGEVKWGRFRLAVPPGAWYGPATVTLVVPSPSVLSCQFVIDPPSANGFAVPVVLTVNATGAPAGKPLVIGCFDPALGKWVPVSGSWHDPGPKLVTAPLFHFSSYGVFVDGKAGW